MSSNFVYDGERVNDSPRVTFLIDGEDYFYAVREAIKLAERSVLILGWDIDSRMRLLRGEEHKSSRETQRKKGKEKKKKRKEERKREHKNGWKNIENIEVADDGLPIQLYPFLREIARIKPNLEVHVLIWDFSMIYAMEREWLPLFKLDWRKDKRLHFHMDDAHPMGASQHQKVVVVDDSIAFAGGMDLTKRRWDSSKHIAWDKRRTDPDGEPYGPFHDTQMMVSGETARALGDLARWRWKRATGKVILPKSEVRNDLWPETVRVDLENVKVRISLTLPAYKDDQELREVESLFVDSILSAKKYIYIENQYLSSKKIGDALKKRITEEDAPEILVIMPRKASGWIEQTTMDVVRARLLRELFDVDKNKKLSVYYPVTSETEPEKIEEETHKEADEKSDKENDKENEGEIESQEVYVHSKLMIIDDHFVRIGSANMSNRSMGLDSECDLSVELLLGDDSISKQNIEDSSRNAVPALRDKLLCEHLKISRDVLSEKIDSLGSVGKAVKSLAPSGNLRELDWEVSAELERQVPETAIIDPEQPIKPEKLIELFVPPETEKITHKRAWQFLLLLLALAGLSIAWRWSPLREIANVDELTKWLKTFASLPGSEALVLLFFSVGAVIGIPVTVLIGATAVAYHPLPAFGLSFVATITAATAAFALGSFLGRATIRRLSGSHLNKLSRKLANRGILTVATFRVIPVAPFSIFNVVAGASHVRFSDYFWGTVLGMTPGLLAMSFFIGSLLDAIREPTPLRIGIVLGVFLVIFLAVFLFSRYISEKKQSAKRQHKARE